MCYNIKVFPQTLQLKDWICLGTDLVKSISKKHFFDIIFSHPYMINNLNPAWNVGRFVMHKWVYLVKECNIAPLECLSCKLQSFFVDVSHQILFKRRGNKNGLTKNSLSYKILKWLVWLSLHEFAAKLALAHKFELCCKGFKKEEKCPMKIIYWTCILVYFS